MLQKLHRLSRQPVLLVVALGLCPYTFASLRPSFNLNYCSWDATDIVLVSTTTERSVFKVEETWKGNLRSGNLIAVPGLEPATNAVPISLYPEHADLLSSETNKIKTQIPKQPVGSRTILFLKRLPAQGVSPTSGRETEHLEWQPANMFGDMKSSVVWIEGSKLYSFHQYVNPGPSMLVPCVEMPCSLTEATLRERVAEMGHVQQDLAAIIKQENGGVRAEHLKPYTLSKAYPVRRFALQELGRCGPLAVTTIRGMLDDPAFANQAPDLIKAYTEAGGEAVAGDLAVRLQRELKFWQAAGPGLPEGWWNRDAWPHAPLRERYSQTLQLIRGLAKTDYRPALQTVIQLRNLWRSYPQLNDPSGLNQMVEECNKLIAHLQRG